MPLPRDTTQTKKRKKYLYNLSPLTYNLYYFEKKVYLCNERA